MPFQQSFDNHLNLRPRLGAFVHIHRFIFAQGLGQLLGKGFQLVIFVKILPCQRFSRHMGGGGGDCD